MGCQWHWFSVVSDLSENTEKMNDFYERKSAVFCNLVFKI